MVETRESEKHDKEEEETEEKKEKEGREVGIYGHVAMFKVRLSSCTGKARLRLLERKLQT